MKKKLRECKVGAALTRKLSKLAEQYQEQPDSQFFVKLLGGAQDSYTHIRGCITCKSKYKIK